MRQRDKRLYIRYRLCIDVYKRQGMFSLGCKRAAHFYKEKAITVYIESAEKSIDKKKAEQYYKQALLLIPDEKAIYQSLVKYFIHPNNFSVEDASILTSVVMTTCKEKAVLDIFKENKREGYMEFCYEIGLGYFYDMGGICLLYTSAVEQTEEEISVFCLEEIRVNEFIQDKGIIAPMLKESFHRAPRIMEHLEKLTLQIENPPILGMSGMEEQRSVFMDIGAVLSMRCV